MRPPSLRNHKSGLSETTETSRWTAYLKAHDMDRTGSPNFDPYHKWLGIPKGKRPPTHYELLAVSLDEEDTDAIRSAAEQRRRFIESKRGEAPADVVNGVLYQIDEAELTLLDFRLRREYDRRLNLFKRRRRNRQVEESPDPGVIRSRPSRAVGEDSGIVRTLAGIVAVLVIAFGVMAWFSFQLPWKAKWPSARQATVANTAPRVPPPRPQRIALPQFDPKPEPDANPELDTEPNSNPKARSKQQAAQRPTAKPPSSDNSSDNGLKAELYVGHNFERLVTSRVDANLNHLWGFRRPSPQVPADHYSVRWTGWLKPPESGEYRLIVVNDDGVRLWLDGKRLIDDWHGHLPKKNSVNVTLDEEPHELKVEYFEDVGSALISLRWEREGVFAEQAIPNESLFQDKESAMKSRVNVIQTNDTNGVQVVHFAGKEFNRPLKELIIPQLEVMGASPVDTSMRMKGRIRAPRPGKYQLIVVTDAGVRLWLNDKLVLDKWIGQVPTSYLVTTEFSEQPVPFRVEYFNVGQTSGVLSLRWIPPGETAEVVIPSSALLPE